jgi:hypothetical protein
MVLEKLEPRCTPASLPLTFSIPGALALKGVYVGITGQLESGYTPSQGPDQGQNLPLGSWVVLAIASGQGLSSADYAIPTPNQNLPLISLFPDTSSIPNTNALQTVTLQIPDFSAAPITSGQVVMSVGSAMALPVSGSGTISAPTASTNPNDRFGLFEWGWDTQNGSFPGGALDLDVSFVDQVGFPYQVQISNPAIAISTISLSGNLATITTASAHGLQAGDTIQIEGVTGATNLNGVTFVNGTPASPTQFNVALPAPTGSYVSGGTIQLLMPSPAQGGVGIPNTRDAVFNGFSTYINGLPASSNAVVFIELGAGISNAPFPTGTRITAPQDVLNNLEIQAQAPTGTAIQGGSLSVGQYVYYAVTATSPSGESLASVPIGVLPYNGSSGGVVIPYRTASLSWSPYPYATGYKVYRAANLSGGMLVNPVLLGSVSAGQSLAWIDDGSQAGTPASPPINNYNYDPLHQYFTPALVDFFNYYKTNDFCIDLSGAVSTTFTGRTTTVSIGSNDYTVLQLTGVAGQFGGQYAGYTVNIFAPFFASNTNQNIAGVTSYPPPPPWLSNPLESPSAMVFACDGVFNTPDNVGLPSTSLAPGGLTLPSTTINVAATTGFPASGSLIIGGPGNTNQLVTYTGITGTSFTGVSGGSGTFTAGVVYGLGSYDASSVTTIPPGIAQDVMNPIVSAFNRGLTPRQSGGTWGPVITPTYWGNDPNPLIGSAVNATIPNGNTALSGTYYYAITATDINAGSNPSGESTLSNLVTVQVGAGENAAFLQWVPSFDQISSSVTGASTSAQTITLADVTGFPASGTLLVTSGTTSSIITYGGIQSGTTTLTNVVVQTGSFPSVNDTAYASNGSTTAGGYNVYRGTTTENLTLIATLPNSTPPVAQFLDTGFPSSTTAPSAVFYPSGSLANYYAAYLHRLSVSINGLAYGYPYDDQGGFSTNLQMRTPQGVTIQFAPWTSATQLQIDTTSSSATAGIVTAFTVVAQDASGNVASDYIGTVTFSSSDPQAILPAPYTFQPSDQGMKTFTVTFLTSGSQTLSISDAANSLEQQAAFQVAPANAAGLRIRGTPRSILAGGITTLHIDAVDAFGNQVPEAEGLITLSGLPIPHTARMIQGTALIRLLPRQAGRYLIQASAGFGTSPVHVLEVAHPERLILATRRSVGVGQPLELFITANRHTGLVDPYYDRPVRMYVNGRLIASSWAEDGTAMHQLAFTRTGRYRIVVQDADRGRLLAARVVRVRAAAPA